ncbi:hypothetical protein OVA07_14945 [Novosphingobium sp. SL115]|uniref:hypothetical protein n=1 Tax=Novosphingobium sp. SL115 TaxID=2995150 RepID=UPI0022730952|nr:hypothetical protein [Novosphingobium sp. SL115]MCY1672302.1 hypothetical protein [Novosphingobium sp. SL115]
MGPDQLGPLIPIIALCIPIVAIWTKHRQKIAEMQINATAELSAEKAAQYAAHTQELEQRVRVLERIVTDKGFDTAAQIEALRRDSAVLEDRRAQ